MTDAATGEHGDLLDLIALNRGHRNLRDTLEEARTFLNEPHIARLLHASAAPQRQGRGVPALRRLAAPSGTVGETYLRAAASRSRWLPALRFHPTLPSTARTMALPCKPGRP